MIEIPLSYRNSKGKVIGICLGKYEFRVSNHRAHLAITLGTVVETGYS